MDNVGYVYGFCEYLGCNGGRSGVSYLCRFLGFGTIQNS